MDGGDDNQRNELFRKNGEIENANGGGMGATAAPSAQQASRYSEQEQVMLQKAKEQNRETTRLAQEALKTVRQTEETAAVTLQELHRQDGQLDKVQKDYEQIDADLRESKQAVNYMNRCCLLNCFACCCACDPHAKEDKSRKQRVAYRTELGNEEKKFAELTAQDKGAQAVRAAKGQVGAAAEEEQQESNRAELMGAKQRLSGNNDNSSKQIGEGLDEADQNEIQAEVRVQDDALDEISEHLDNIRHMAEAMGGTLQEQDKKIDAIAGRTDHADDSMKDLQKKMKKVH